MDPREQGFLEATLRLLEVELAKEAEKNRLMAERLRTDQVALRAKERERSILLTEKDRVLGLKETGETLVDAFHQLEADGLDNQNELMDAIAAWMNNFGGGHGNGGGGFAGV